jgi:hypothetical protein
MMQHTRGRCGRISTRYYGLCAMVAAMLVSHGCGTGQYEQRLADTLQKRQARAPFELSLNLNNTIGETPIRLGLPKTIVNVITPGMMLDGQEIDSSCLKIPFLDLPKGLIVYQAFVDTPEGKMPYYFYMAALDISKYDILRSAAGHGLQGETKEKLTTTPEGGRDRMDTTGQIYQAFKKAIPQFAGKWEDVQFPTADGDQIQWQKLRIETPQEFVFYSNGGDRPKKKLDGVLELYARVERDWLVLLGWRAWKGHQTNIEMDRLMPLVAGSVKL